MKTFILPAIALLLVACSGESAEPAEASAAAAHITAEASAMSGPFDVASVPLSEAELPAFPYIDAPEGFHLTGAKTLELERKYVFPHGATEAVEGRYHHGRVMVSDSGAEWNETLLLSRLDAGIRALGGVRLFDGAMPQSARALLESENPRFAQDLYDPAPYRFRQYAVRTGKALIWVEVGYGYNAPMIDLTVLEQPLPAAA